MQNIIDIESIKTKDNTVIINQPFGLGDILFLEPMCRHLTEKGFKVIFPVHDHYVWLQDYIPYVDFRESTYFNMDYEAFSVEYYYEGYYVIPTRFANPLLRGFEPHFGGDKPNWMRDKYLLVGLDPDMWSSLRFSRNFFKEVELFNALGLVEGDRYAFVNTYFADNYQTVDVDLSSYTGKVIQMRKEEGYTLLDWMHVIEMAEEIHTVETSVMYVVDSLADIRRAKSLYLYPRKPYEDKPIGVLNFINDKWTIK